MPRGSKSFPMQSMPLQPLSCRPRLPSTPVCPQLEDEAVLWPPHVPPPADIVVSNSLEVSYLSFLDGRIFIGSIHIVSSPDIKLVSSPDIKRTFFANDAMLSQAYAMPVLLAPQETQLSLLTPKASPLSKAS